MWAQAFCMYLYAWFSGKNNLFIWLAGDPPKLRFTCTVNLQIFVLRLLPVKFFSCWVDYENLTRIQWFDMGVKGEHGRAAKTLLHSRLPCLSHHMGSSHNAQDHSVLANMKNFTDEKFPNLQYICHSRKHCT